MTGEPIVPVAPDAFPSFPAYAAAWGAQRAHEEARLADLLIQRTVAAVTDVQQDTDAEPLGRAADECAPLQIGPARRARFRRELRARALARQYHIVSPDRWPESAGRDVLRRMATAPSTEAPAPTADAVAGWAPWYDDIGVAAGEGRELADAACEQWLRLPPTLPRGRHVALTVRGASMHPLLADGDVVLVRLGPAAWRGHVVVARRPTAGCEAGYVVKCVGGVRDDVVTLESLNPEFAPVTVPHDGRHVLGTVVARWARGG